MARKEIDIELLNKELKHKNITLSELSELTNISKSHLSLMLNDKRNMSVKKLNKILEVTNINLKDISRK